MPQPSNVFLSLSADQWDGRSGNNVQVVCDEGERRGSDDEGYHAVVHRLRNPDKEVVQLQQSRHLLLQSETKGEKVRTELHRRTLLIRFVDCQLFLAVPSGWIIFSVIWPFSFGSFIWLNCCMNFSFVASPPTITADGFVMISLQSVLFPEDIVCTN